MANAGKDIVVAFIPCKFGSFSAVAGLDVVFSPKELFRGKSVHVTIIAQMPSAMLGTHARSGRTDC